MMTSIRQYGWMLGSVLGALTLAACDLPGKNIGDADSMTEEAMTSSNEGETMASSTGEDPGATSVVETGDSGTTGTTGEGSMACAGIDHGACWTAISAVWDSNGPLTPAAIAEFEACYGNPALSLPPERLIDGCSAELEGGCLGQSGDASCGATYCECALGDYPFDWSTCYAIAMSACDAGGTFAETPECLTILDDAGCYSGADPATLGACYESVNGDGEGNCSCPMCTTDWGACEDAMDNCVGV